MRDAGSFSSRPRRPPAERLVDRARGDTRGRFRHSTPAPAAGRVVVEVPGLAGAAAARRRGASPSLLDLGLRRAELDPAEAASRHEHARPGGAAAAGRARAARRRLLRGDARGRNKRHVKSFNLFDGELDDERTEPAASRGAPPVSARCSATRSSARASTSPDRRALVPLPLRVRRRESGCSCRRSPHAARARRAARAARRDVVCSRKATGAHLVRNDTDEPVRFLIASTKDSPQLASTRTAARSACGPGTTPTARLFRRDDAVGYWEASPETRP